MLFRDLGDKDVVNVKDGSCLGHVKDIDFDPERGCICALIVPGPGKYFGCIYREFDFFIPWVNILKIGPDIVLVELDCEKTKHKI